METFFTTRSLLSSFSRVGECSPRERGVINSCRLLYPSVFSKELCDWVVKNPAYCRSRLKVKSGAESSLQSGYAANQTLRTRH